MKKKKEGRMKRKRKREQRAKINKEKPEKILTLELKQVQLCHQGQAPSHSQGDCPTLSFGKQEDKGDDFHSTNKALGQSCKSGEYTDINFILSIDGRTNNLEKQDATRSSGYYVNNKNIWNKCHHAGQVNALCCPFGDKRTTESIPTAYTMELSCIHLAWPLEDVGVADLLRE